MPFRHPDRSDGLNARIEFEVRERLEEALDYVCLDALVRTRRARGLPAPVADSAADRAEYHEHVRALLCLLDSELRPDGAARPPSKAAAQEQAQLLQTQVTLARTLPDYWQRFEALSARYLAEPVNASGGKNLGFLARLFGRG